MSRFARALAAAAFALAAVAAAAFSAAVAIGEHRLGRALEVRVVPVPFARDAEAVRRGKAAYEARRCAQCHGEEGGGRVVHDESEGLYVRAPDITRGGATAAYVEADWVRAVRHGVDPHGRPLLFMPSEDYNRMPDAELAALVAYVRSLPAAGAPEGGARVRLPLRLKALYGLGLERPAAWRIDHRLPPAP